ncbi:cyclic nucleotide-binding domain-containing protein [uncultured Croceitalea sp.]|uniref:Crp/Fnr family transcriptional regulator n=1 Tax=uncultured Croceitalea sp. TaxID=1798908 RepID=UPI003305F7FE
MKQKLSKYISRYVDFNTQELDLFFNSLEVKKYKKKEYLVQEGKVCKYKYFIIDGLTRTYNIDQKGNEKIIQFGIENWWVTNIESFKNNSKSNHYIQALEDTTTLRIKKEELDMLYQKINKLERLFRLITENWLIAIQRRNEFYLKLTSKERYEMFVKAFPNFIQRVPQYMIASYLEITPEYLSALRAN